MKNFSIRSDESVARLSLGTVQFGLAYGVSNACGQVAPDEVVSILNMARAVGIDTLDTAIAYGESEAVLGRAGTEGWKVVSKLPAVPDDVDDVTDWVRKQLKCSMQRLCAARLDGLLLHRPDQLSGVFGDDLERVLLQLKDEGLVAKVGVSIYNSAELAAFFQRRCIDLVQVPFNILDQSLLRSGWVRRLKDTGVELHVRSVFLQGLLLMDARRPPRFARWQSFWDQWSGWLVANELTPLQACLRYVLSVREIDRVVVGVESCAQLQEILSAADGALPAVPDWQIAETDLLLNPAKWNFL